MTSMIYHWNPYRLKVVIIKTESIKDTHPMLPLLPINKLKTGRSDLEDVMPVGYTVVHDRDEIVYAARGNVSDNNQNTLS